MTLSVLDRILIARSDEQVNAAGVKEREHALGVYGPRGTCCACGGPTYRADAVRCTKCCDLARDRVRTEEQKARRAEYDARRLAYRRKRRE